MTNRVLTRSAISFLLGIVLSRYGNLWTYLMWIIWLTGLGLAGCFRSGRRSRKGRQILALVICLVFGLLGFYRYHMQQDLITEVESYLSCDDVKTVVGRIYKKEEKNSSIVYYLKDSYIKSKNGGLEGSRTLIYLNVDDYSIGDTIQVIGKCEYFNKACNEGNFDARQYYYSKNILFYMKADRVELLEKVKLPWKERLYQLRRQIQQVYLQMMPGKEAGILSVMTLGDKGIMDEEIKKLYQQSGISHVLAISGLHISILGMGIYRFLRKCRISYAISGMIAGFLAVAFGEISGMELSTQRAVAMFLIMLVGNVMGMAYDSVTALSFAALWQLWENPLCLWYAGFQFSYLAVLAVVVAVKVLQGNEKVDKKQDRRKKEQEGEKGQQEKKYVKRLGKWKKELFNTFFVSSCIQLVTLPLTIYYYYEFPVYSVVINGLLLPFMGLLLLSGLLGGLLGVANGSWGGLSWLLIQPARLLLNWNEWLCSQFSRLPGAVFITGQPQLWMLLVYYGILAAGLALIYEVKTREAAIFETKVGEGLAYNIKAKEEPLHGMSAGVMLLRMRKIKRVALAVILIMLLIVIFVRPKREFQVCFLDVGQGDGIFLQTEDAAFFIDGGSSSERNVGEYRILSFLKYRGIRYVDGWFVSHADTDHMSGLLEVWESGYEIKCLLLAEEISRDEAWEELCDMAEVYGTNIVYLSPQDTITAGELRLTCLGPWEEENDRNENSLVLCMEYPGMAGIFAGDISKAKERELMQRYPDLVIDLYKANHHGSDNSNSRAWMEQLSPVLTVVSCALENSYGHPGKAAVERIEAVGSGIYYTMESGQITVGCENGRIWVREYKE